MRPAEQGGTGEARQDTAVAAKPTHAAGNSLRVKIWSPFQIYYDGIAQSISGVNGTGSFDILPKHHNFITILTACELSLQAAEGEVKIRISGGIMQVHKDTVTVFLEV